LLTDPRKKDKPSVGKCQEKQNFLEADGHAAKISIAPGLPVGNLHDYDVGHRLLKPVQGRRVFVARTGIALKE
jgi:hypothetical protein